MSADTAPAAMPGEEEIHAAMLEAQRVFRAERDAKLAGQGLWPDRSPAPLDVLARAILALFAPILAEKERRIANLTYGLEEAVETSVKVGMTWQGAAEKAEARALAAEANFETIAQGNQVLIDKLYAAEAALAAERERCIAIVDGYDPTLNARTGFADEIAAAIRAQAE